MSKPSTTSSNKRKRGAEMKFYAVREGHKPGIYHSWADCKDQITGFKGAIYKSFTSLTEAEAFVKGTDTSSSSSGAPKKFYAVQCGKIPGVYTTWPEAQAQIIGWTKPKHKSFPTRAEAEAFVNEANQVADAGTVFPTESPPLKVLNLTNGNSEAVETGLTSKRAKTPKPKPATPTGPGYDPLQPEAEDGFDDRILMDPSTGKLRYKTEQEQGAMKLMPNTDHSGKVLNIWTDGACMFNGQEGASVAGVGVYFGPRDPRNLAEPLTGRQTNNRAELTALKRALSIAPLNRDVNIHSDSKYSIDCVTVWFVNWKSKGWKTASGKDVENKELIQEILKIIDERHICRSKTNFTWVKGHAGHEENEEADRLAVKGALENQAKGIAHVSATNGGNPVVASGDNEDMEHSFWSASQRQGDLPMT